MSLLLFLIFAALLVVLFIFGYTKKLLRRMYFMRIASTVSLFVIMLGVNLLPLSIGNRGANVSNRDIIFVVDLTLSMNAEDGRDNKNDQTRLDNVREDLKKIAKDNIGAATGILTFSDQTTIFLPLTTNNKDLNDSADTLFTATSYNVFPKIEPYSEVMKHLNEYLAAQKKTDATRERIVIFMSDFEIFNKSEASEQIVSESKKLAENAGGFLTIAYGKESGSKILRTKYDYESGKIVPNHINNSFPSDDTSNEIAGFDITKYLDAGAEGDYDAAISKANYDLARQIASSVKGKSITYTETDKYQETLLATAKSAANYAARDEKSKALRQNWLYSPLTLCVFAWLVLFEVIKPRFMQRIVRRLGGIHA